MNRVRIAVTGVGLVTPLGLTREATWQGLLAGERSVRWLDAPGVAESMAGKRDWPRCFGATVPCEIPHGASRQCAFALRAAREAAEQACLTPDQLRTAGCVIGTSKIEMQQFDQWARRQNDPPAAPQNVDVLFPSSAAFHVARELGCSAAALCPVAACATGLVSIIRGANLIREGHCPVVLAGSTDASLHPGLLASYRRLKVLADPGEDPGRACRPFDRTRSGFAVGEGAGILVLEDWDHAFRRGALPMAEWVDGRIGSDPTGLTSVDGTGATLAKLIQRLLSDCCKTPREISVIQLHGTGTRLNDRAEAAALQHVCGAELPFIPAFGLKGAIGHLMGAAGAVETAACVLALAHQGVPPTVNFQLADAECGLRLSSQALTSVDVSDALKISLGFGGQMAVGLLRRHP